jgi:hypothetical protein
MNVRIGLLLVPLLLLVVLFAIALVWWLPRSRRTLDLDPSRQVALLAGYRKAVGWRWAGFGLGVVVACVTAATVRVGLYNLGAMLAPTVFGLCVTGGVVVGNSRRSHRVRASGRRPSSRGPSATICQSGSEGWSPRALSAWAPSW